MIALALLAALAAQQTDALEVPLAPIPPTPPVPELFRLAAEAYARKDGDGCAKLGQQALSSGELDEAQTLQAWMMRGACFHVAGEDDKARRSYAVALRLKADVAAGPNDDNDAFRAARKEAQPLSFHGARIPDPPDTVEVEIGGDDLLLVKSAILVRASADGVEEMARFPLDAEHAKHRVSGLGDGPLTLVLLDKHGNKLVHQDIAADAEHVITRDGSATPAAGAAPTILTTLGATAIGAGLVGIVVSGIGVASLENKALEDGQLWLVGVGASTGLFLVGASLVVVDQGLN